MALEKELEIFEEHRDEWCDSNRGKFVVIQGEIILEPFFDEWEDGLKAGYTRFGVTRPFLVKQIFAVDPVFFIGVVRGFEDQVPSMLSL